MNKYDMQHNRSIAANQTQVQSIIDKYERKLVALAKRVTIDPSKPFSFYDYPSIKKEYEKLMKDMSDEIRITIENAERREWERANDKNDELVASVVKASQNAQKAVYMKRNLDALSVFALRKQSGLDLSGRVWNITDQYRVQIEMAIDVALKEHLTADELSRSVRKYLKYPDKLFRRVRDEHGVLHLSKAAKAFHPGQGVYRSSYMNARRLAATEINMAYRTSDHVRQQQLDFVVGIEVHLSNNHNCKGVPDGEYRDICDELQGKYPKTFKFTGWHPHCRCYVTTILKTPDEVKRDIERKMEGKEPLPSVNEVKDVPQGFKDWVENNQDRIARAKSLPYFLRDNGTMEDGEWKMNQLYFEPEKPTLLDIAEKRHAERTPEQIADIKARAEERQKLLKEYAITKKRTDNILNMQSEWTEVDFSALKKAADIVKAGSAYRKSEMAELKNALNTAIGNIKNQLTMEKALSDVIPDVHKWHKQFTLDELKAANDAVQKKMLDIQAKTGSDLAMQKKLVGKEMMYVSDPNYLKVHTLHKTWEVAQQSYLKQIAIIDEKIAWEPIEKSLAAIKSYSAANPKSLKIAGLIAEAEKIKASGGSIMSVQNKIAEAEKIKAKNEASVISHAKKAMKDKILKLTKQKTGLIIQKDAIELDIEKAKLNGDKALLKVKQKELKKVQEKIDKVDNELGDTSDIFSDVAYSDARKKAAKKFINAPEADDYFHQYAKEIWPKLTDEEKEALWGYTAGSGYITEPLRAINGHYYYYTARMKETESHIRALTKAIDKCGIKDDVFIKRDDAAWGVEYVFGIKDLQKFKGDPKALIGMTGTDESFISCGTCTNTFFTATGRKDVIFRIYCPRGTKGTYCQPFSSCGTYGRRWDGIKKSNPTNRAENEFLLQRGTKYRITDAKYDHTTGKWTIDIEVIGQSQRDFVIKMGGGGYYCEFL